MHISHRLQRVALIFTTLMLAVMVGVAIPMVTYAAPPMQDQPAQTPGELSAAILMLAGMIAAFVAGGGISVILQMIPAWVAWQSPVKGYVVIALSILTVAGLSSIKVLATPEAFASLPQWLIVFVGSVLFSLTAIFGTQITYKRFLA